MSEELDMVAAELVLGTLSADERARLTGRLESDPALREAVRQWRARLAPLDAAVLPEAPPAGIWRHIERVTASEHGSADATPTNVVQLRRKVALWRGGALAAGALAAALAGVVVIDRLALRPEPQGGRYVAVVDTGGREPALIAEVDTNTGLIRIRSLHADTPAGRSLELWHIPEGEKPRSLGILQASADGQTIRDAVAKGPVGGVIAVTVEPEGGSPSGDPTGPVVYSGRLVPVE